MYNFLSFANAKTMKKYILGLVLCICCFGILLSIKPVFVTASFAQEDTLLGENTPRTDFSKPKASLLAIVIDDFGGYERGGVDDLLNSNIPITCAIMPFVDNTQSDYTRAIEGGKEVILHMPMQAHVNLPENWYGEIYIKNTDTPETAINKLQKCLNSLPKAKGFNIHIGSGVSQNVELMKSLYEYANNNNMFFLDSRTILSDKCEEACNQANSIYLGRDVFLEPEHNRSHTGVTSRLQEGVNIAHEKGYAIVIGHVGPEGGINTSRAIIDFANSAKEQNIEIVPLSTIYEHIKNNHFQ